MSIQEKKSAKGTPYAIIKFSDKNEEFELFLFSEILIKNREKIKESESFIITLHKDKIISENQKRRINVKKILSLEELVSKPYSSITIEIRNNYNLEELQKILNQKGNTKIKLIVNDKNKKVNYTLNNNRKFDLSDFKALKSKHYVEKIIF